MKVTFNLVISIFSLLLLLVTPHADAGLKSKAILLGSGIAIKQAIKNPKLRHAVINEARDSPVVKEKLQQSLSKFISNKKNYKYKSDAETFLSQIKGDIKKLDPAKTSGQIRGSPGTSFGTKLLSELSPKQWKLSIAKNGEKIPKSIGDKLSGKTYKNFDEFRKDFWLEISKNEKFIKEFSKSNQGTLKKGQSPFVEKGGEYGLSKRYELHHIKPIQNGGAVYDMNNLIIVTPKMHRHLHLLMK